MTPTALEDLVRLSQARQEADAAKLQKIRAEEQKIRAQLAALDDRNHMARSLPAQAALPQRSLGVDMLWQVWVGRRRRELQMQLARCLAHKGAARRALQKSFGKSAALGEVTEDLNAKACRLDRLKTFEAITDFGVLQRTRGV